MADGQNQLDTRALEIAMEARTLITAHITECKETRQEVLRKFDESARQRDQLFTYIKGKTDGLNRVIWNGAIGLIVLLVTIVGYFLATDGLPGRRAEPVKVESHKP